MENQKELNSFRTLFLLILFLFYYAGIALLCWALLSSNHEVVRACLGSKKMVVLILLGFSSGCFLFMSAMPWVELGYKWAWRTRDWRGLGHTSMYLMSNFLLAVFPFVLVQYGAFLSQQLTPAFFLLSTLVFLILTTYRRFQGMSHLGLTTCAH